MEILDKKKHKNTRTLTGRGAEYGENIDLVPVIAEELNKLVLEYPVCLIKDNDTGQFGLNALLGLEVGENFFLQGGKWLSSYIPLHIRRQPFMVGFNAQHSQQPTPENTVITINTAYARVQEESGELTVTLYNIKLDQSELHNLAYKYPEKVRELYKRIFEWELTLERPL